MVEDGGVGEGFGAIVDLAALGGDTETPVLASAFGVRGKKMMSV